MPELIAQGVKVDMILCDLPYGTTACKWDTVIPFEPLWECYKGLIKDNGAIVLTASQPFTSALVMSNVKMFRYEWIWEKGKGGSFMTANKLPLKRHENILVFYKKPPKYNPQKTIAEKIDNRKSINNPVQKKKDSTILLDKIIRKKDDGTRFPVSVIKIKSYWNKNQHPTQKPVALFEYLIKTYTNEGDLVLDNCAGSFTTAIACLNTNRNYMCIEQEQKYFDIGQKRITDHLGLFAQNT